MDDGDDVVYIFDTTLRDGEQSPGASLNTDEKLEVARQLERLGVDVIEAGFPVTSPDDLRAVSLIAQEIKGSTICGLARAVSGDIDAAWEALQTSVAPPRIHTFISSSDIHLQHQMRMTRQQALEAAVGAVQRAKSYVQDVEFSPMDATRSDPAFVYQMLQAVIKAGATTINIPDTVGYATPTEFGALIEGIFENVPNIGQAVVSAHCHNDLGMATANSLAGVRAGARQVECTINGLGERAGNAALEEIVMAISTRRDFFDLRTNVDTTQIYPTSRLVSHLTGFAVQRNKAIVGANAFAHEAGIHQDGVLKERTTYEIMDATSIGLVKSRLVLGKHSGRHALRVRLAELGYHLDPDELDRAFARFKEVADKKKEVDDRDLRAIVEDELWVAPEIYKLEHVQVSCGDHSVPTATVRIRTPRDEVQADANLGTGPVDAVYRAINRVINVPNELIEFSVKAVTEGIDAIGEVTIRIRSGRRVFSGHGASTDIIVASARAYMNALNKLVAYQREREGKAEASTLP
ncbi:MAG: 2-isopropylmalate synthase [Chloroflexota bacterium]|nr:2-isopropylmalate synthase [Chloroflexota bacterium]